MSISEEDVSGSGKATSVFVLQLLFALDSCKDPPAADMENEERGGGGGGILSTRALYLLPLASATKEIIMIY